MTIKITRLLFLVLLMPLAAFAVSTTKDTETSYPCGKAITYNAANSFSNYTGIDGFSPAYLDENNACLAIDASQYKDVFAAAKSFFAGMSGAYDVSITTLAEVDGESSYRLLVNGDLVGEFKNPSTTVDYAEKVHTWKNVAMTIGATIQVEFSSHTNGKVAEGSSTAYSRGRWTSLAFQALCEGTPPCTLDDDVFAEKDGVLVIEAESALDYASKGFTKGTGDGTLGDGYLYYSGPAHFNHLGIATPANTLEYRIHISTPGTYRFMWRNSRDLHAETFDAGNDSWLKIEADDYYAMKNSTKIDCNAETVFLKVWVQKSTFVYEAWGEAYHAKPAQNSVLIYATFDKVGEYSIKYGGRTPGHMVDRMMLFLDDDVHKTIAFNTATPESQRGCKEEVAGLQAEEVVTASKLYPNPTSGIFYFENLSEIVGVEVLDIRGRSMIQKTIDANMTSLDISSLERGAYLVRMTDKRGNVDISRVLKN